MQNRMTIVCLLAWVAGCSSAMRSTAPAAIPEPFAQLPPAWAADTIKLDDARAIAIAVGIEKLFARVATTSPYYTDFIGAHALRPVPQPAVLADFVPRHATVVSQSPHKLSLQFRAGYRIDFAFNSQLYLDQNPVATAYAFIDPGEPATYPANAVAFRALLDSAGLLKKYLIPNPYLAAETRALERMQAAASIDSMVIQRDRGRFARSPHAVMLIGETHGAGEAKSQVTALLATDSVDWLGIEMVSEDLQPALSTYIDAAANTPAYHTARQRLLDYFSRNWNTRDDERTADPKDNPYMRLLEHAKRNGKKVYALDAPTSYTFFRFGEFPLGTATRDYIWASNIPAQGRGVVYGGSSHFLQSRRPNFLTFLREVYPKIEVFK